MTSLDQNISLATIVQSYRDYKPEDVSLVKELVKKGEWDDHYLLAIKYEIEEVFDVAIKYNNVPAMDKIFSNHPLRWIKKFEYFIRRGKLDQMIKYSHEIRYLDFNILYSLTFEYDQMEISRYLILNHNSGMNVWFNKIRR